MMKEIPRFEGPTTEELARIEKQEMPLLELVDLNDQWKLILKSIPPVGNLNIEESAKLGRRVKAGLKPDGSLTEDALEARNTMMYSCTGMSARLAIRFSCPGAEALDLFQQGYIGLQEAAMKFDPERGVKFSTYAHWYCMKEIATVARKMRVRAREDNFSDLTSNDNDSDILDIGIFESAFDTGNGTDIALSRDELDRMKGRIDNVIDDIGKGSPHQAEIVKLKFQGATNKELMEQFGVTRSEIQQLQERFLRKVKDPELHIILWRLLFPKKANRT